MKAADHDAMLAVEVKPLIDFMAVHGKRNKAPSEPQAAGEPPPNEPTPAYVAAVARAALGIGLTLAAGFLGWNMVQKHHVGIDMTPEQERIDDVQAGRPGGASQPAHRDA